MKRRIERPIICDICGAPGARIRRVAETHGKGKALLVVENIPMINCPHCGESYFTSETLREIERLKRRRHELAVQQSVAVLAYG
jgi:YgiT-type zinc finger domain-containing protein